MDEMTQKVFDETVQKEVEALTPSDKDFLRARSKYLSREQKRKYDSVLAGQSTTQEHTDPDTDRSKWSEHPADQPTDAVDQDEEDEDE